MSPGQQLYQMKKSSTVSKNAQFLSEDQFLNAHSWRVFVSSIRKGHILGALFFAVMLFGSFAFCSTYAVSHALLYIFAFDGKMSGRMDGNVLMRNGRGRAFVVPALVRNSYTITARALFSQFSSGYNGLTPAQILAWSEFSMGVSNRMGQAKTIKGKDCYVRLNVNLTLVAGAPITNPPVLVGVTTPITSGTLTATAVTGVVSLAYAPSPTAGTTEHLVFATKPLRNSITKPSKSAYRLIGIITSGSATPFVATTAYAAKFGAITGLAGDKIFMSLTAIDNATGQAAPSVGVVATIA